MALNDWGCDSCGCEQRDVVLAAGVVPNCETCGEPMVTLWDHGKPPATDLRSESFCFATQKWHSSTRQIENELADQSLVLSERSGRPARKPKIAGDRHHGAPTHEPGKPVPVVYKRQYKVPKSSG